MYNLRNQLIDSKEIPDFLDNPEGKYIDHQMVLPVIGYDKFFPSIAPLLTKKGYETNMLKNIILGLQLLGIKETLKNFIESVAKKYHSAYLEAKYGY